MLGSALATPRPSSPSRRRNRAGVALGRYEPLEPSPTENLIVGADFVTSLEGYHEMAAEAIDVAFTDKPRTKNRTEPCIHSIGQV